MSAIKILKKIYHQINYNKHREKGISLIFKYIMRYKYDCYISPKANIFHPHSIKLSKGVYIHRNALINFLKNSELKITLSIGENTIIMPYAILSSQTDKITIGKNCSIHPFCELRGRGGLTIGNDTRIGTGSAFYPNNHIYKDPDIPIRLQGETYEGITVGNDVLIGANVKVLDGVTIGNGCVIGAGSVVTKSIPPYSVAVGVPAKVIKQRK